MSETGRSVYEPRGKVKAAVDMMRADPMREFTSRELAVPLACDSAAVGQFLATAASKKVIFRRNVGRTVVYRFAPFEVQKNWSNGNKQIAQAEVAIAPDDFRVPRFGEPWKPAPMVCTRPTAGTLVQQEIIDPPETLAGWMARGDDTPPPSDESDKSTASAATARGHEIPDSASTPEQAEAAGPGQERHQVQDRHADGSQERCGEVANEGDARAVSGADASIPEGAAADADEEEAEEVQEFDFCRWRDGSLQVWGIAANDDGSFTLSAEQMLEIKRAIAWSPA